MPYRGPMPRFASVILVDRAGRLLLQERDEHPRIDPECWGLPGGHVEAGESDEQAAYRELAEETGVELAPGTLQRYDEFRVWHEAYGVPRPDPASTPRAATSPTPTSSAARAGRSCSSPPTSSTGRPLAAGLAAIAPPFLSSDLYRKLATP